MVEVLQVEQDTHEGPSIIQAIRDRVATSDPHEPEVLLQIVLDEAHGLSKVSITNSPREKTLYDVFLSAFTDFGADKPMFLISLSTHSHLAKHARPLGKQASDRGVSPDAYHQAPYTELPFDCFPANQPIFVPGQLTLKDVSEARFMVQFGRPLCVH